MKKVSVILILSSFLTAFQMDAIKKLEASLTGNREQVWLFENTTPLMSDEKDAGSLAFRLKDHTFSFNNNSKSRDIVSAAANGTGKWKIITSDNIEYFLVLNRDTLNIEFGVDMKLGKSILILTKKSHKLENPSYINTYIEK